MFPYYNFAPRLIPVFHLLERCVSQPVQLRAAGVSFPDGMHHLVHSVPRPARRRAAGRQASRDAMRESNNHSRSGRGVWTAVATVAVSALALTGRAASHRAAGVSDQSSSLGAGRSRWGGWRERRDAWRPEEDRLAAAVAERDAKGEECARLLEQLSANTSEKRGKEELLRQLEAQHEQQARTPGLLARAA